MNNLKSLWLRHVAGGAAVLVTNQVFAAEPAPAIPRFSVANMDRSVEPAADFYHYAAGGWLKNNPVPADKSRWSGFEELQERNWRLLREILEASAATPSAPAHSPRREVGDFFAAAMETNRLEKLAFKPIEPDLKRIERIKSTRALFELVADFHSAASAHFSAMAFRPMRRTVASMRFTCRKAGWGCRIAITI